MASSVASRWRSSLGQDGFEGVMVLPHTKAVHTIGMRFAIDVAFADRELRVLDTTTMVT